MQGVWQARGWWWLTGVDATGSEMLVAGDHRAKGQLSYAANCVEAVIGALALDRGSGHCPCTPSRCSLPPIALSLICTSRRIDMHLCLAKSQPPILLRQIWMRAI